MGRPGRQLRAGPAGPERRPAMAARGARRAAELAVGDRRAGGRPVGLGTADGGAVHAAAVLRTSNGSPAGLRGGSGRGAGARRRRADGGPLDVRAVRPRPAVRGGGSRYRDPRGPRAAPADAAGQPPARTVDGAGAGHSQGVAHLGVRRRRGRAGVAARRVRAGGLTRSGALDRGESAPAVGPSAVSRQDDEVTSWTDRGLRRPHEQALDAAGIADPWLREAYETARELNALHGRTYYLSALLLPPDRRPHVYALYGFARWADELIDSLDAPDPEGLVTWSERALHDLRVGHSDDPVVAAAAHTARVLGIDIGLFDDFLASMRQDIDTTGYATYDDLRRYMWGSASVIGLMMLPVLGPLTPDAREPAGALGGGVQLSNFPRGVGGGRPRGPGD